MPLSGVVVSATLQEEPVATITNQNGYFLLESNNELEPSNKPEVIRNVLAWSEEKQLQIELFSLNGHVISSERSYADRYILPSLRPGLYAMKVIVDQSIFGYKVASDGTHVYLVDKKGNHSSVSNTLDTLSFSREEYLTQQKVVANVDGHLNVRLLRRSYQQSVDYLNELSDPVVFDLLGGAPSRTNLAEVTSIKLIYDMEQDKIYYQNTSKYIYHYYFAEQVLGYNKGHFTYNATQYRDHPDRKYLMGSVNYYHSQDRYVLQLVTANQMSCDQLGTLFNTIEKTSYFGDELVFLIQSATMKGCPNVRNINSEELFEGQNFQSLNEARNYGYLKKVKLEDLESTFLNRRDLVVLYGIPNDIPVVAGIITTEFQTPLSHINILSHSRGTPNIVLRDAYKSSLIEELDGQLVFLDVQSNSYELRPADFSEAESFWEEREPQHVTVLNKDLAHSELITMSAADISFISSIGGKAANFAEISQLKDQRGYAMPIPEGDAFAIPFYYYDEHVGKSGIDVWLDSLMKDASFLEDPVLRSEALEKIRDSIKNTPVSDELLTEVNERINDFTEFEAYRFRSSTNAEDLAGFTGAGLYDSKSAKKNDPEKTVEKAIQKVWASLWNWRAYEERSYFKIDHKSCAMGILVHRSFPDEDANGVMITSNLYNDNEGYTINVQFGEESIVFPEPGVLHDQIILFDGSLDPRENFMIEYLSFSNLPGYEGTVLKDDELHELGYFAKAMKQHYYYNVPNNCQCSYKEFGMDIEFKVDSEVSPRKVYIKQARPFY